MLLVNEELSYKNNNLDGNLFIHGENVAVMNELSNGHFNLKESIDLMLWDPPYNTGNKHFMYDDKFDSHAAWLSFMKDRLILAKDMLKESGSIAIHISQHELFRLGFLMDEVFGERNRMAIINWECAFAAKNDSKGIPSSTDYVLVYAKKKDKAYRGLLPRTESMNKRYKHVDPEGCYEKETVVINRQNQGRFTYDSLEGHSASWMPENNSVGIESKSRSKYRQNQGRFMYGSLEGQPAAWRPESNTISAKNHTYQIQDGKKSKSRSKYVYGIENPITGEMHYPPAGREWRSPIHNVLRDLQGWNVEYQINDEGDCVVSPLSDRANAQKVQDNGPLPRILFSRAGLGMPRYKRYLSDLKNDGRVTGTYWESEDALNDVECVALRHEESGHNDGAKRLIKAIIGGNVVFDTPKPLKLTKRLIEVLCPKDGIVLDAFGGSATTGHAVLDLNAEGSNRRFIVIEMEEFANSISAERLRRVIEGSWAHPTKETKPLGGSFTYLEHKGE